MSPSTGRLTGRADHTVFAVILAISFCHLLNDMMQSLLPAIYPESEGGFRTELRPDRHRDPGLPAHRVDPAAAGGPVRGPAADAAGTARRHPVLARRAWWCCRSRIATGAAGRRRTARAWARRCSTPSPRASPAWRPGGRHGLAQSLFQVGGNAGQALGPLAAALVVVRWGQSSLVFFALLALLSGAILWNVGIWYKHHGLARLSEARRAKARTLQLPPRSVSAACRAAGAGVLQVCLSGEPDQLFHVLSDSPLRRVGAGGAAGAVCLPRPR